MRTTGWLLWGIIAAAVVLLVATMPESYFWPVIAVATPTMILLFTRPPKQGAG